MAEQRAGAGGERLRIGDHLRGHVARIAGGAELRDVAFQHRAHRRIGLRHRHAVLLRRVGRHDPGAARGDQYRRAARFRRPRLGEERRRLQQPFVVFHQYGAGMAEGGAIGLVRPGERAGVRHRRLCALRPGGHLVDDQRLAAFGRERRRVQDAPRFGRALEGAGDGGAARVFGEVGDVVGHIDVAGIARGQHVADGGAARHALGERHAERARLADDADRPSPGRGDRGDGHERRPRLQCRVDKADGVRPDDAQAGGARDGGQPLLLGAALRLAGLGVAGGEDDGAADAGSGGLAHDRLHRLARCGDHRAVDRRADRGQGGMAGAVADPFIARVHRVHRPGEIDEVRKHPLPERAGARGGADHGDAGRMQQPVQLGMTIESGARRWHGCDPIDVSRARAYSTGSNAAQAQEETDAVLVRPGRKSRRRDRIEQGDRPRHRRAPGRARRAGGGVLAQGRRLRNGGSRASAPAAARRWWCLATSPARRICRRWWTAPSRIGAGSTCWCATPR